MWFQYQIYDLFPILCKLNIIMICLWTENYIISFIIKFWTHVGIKSNAWWLEYNLTLLQEHELHTINLPPNKTHHNSFEIRGASLDGFIFDNDADLYYLERYT